MTLKRKFGYMKCPDCSARVVVKVNDHGTLAYTCDECDSRAYAQKGTGVYDAWIARITDKVTAPPPKGEPNPPAKKSMLDGIV